MLKAGTLLRTSAPKITVLSTAERYLNIPKDKKLLEGFESVRLPGNTIKLWCQSAASTITTKQCFIFPTGTLVAWSLTLEELKALQKELTPFAEGTFTNKPLELEEIASIEDESCNDGDDWMEISKKLNVLAQTKRLQHQVQHFIGEMECILQDWRRMNHRPRGIWGKFSLRRRVTAQLMHLKHLNLQFRRLFVEKSSGPSQEAISKLEKEFEVANELGDWIYELIEHRHSLALEWCIILLIAGEILIGLCKR